MKKNFKIVQKIFLNVKFTLIKSYNIYIHQNQNDEFTNRSWNSHTDLC